MNPDVESVIERVCEFHPSLSMIGRQLLPRIRANMGARAPYWSCTAIGKELEKSFVVERLENGEQLFHGIATIPNKR